MIALSKRQYAMLAVLVDAKNEYMDVETAQTLDQRPFRSMLIQKWVAYRPGKGFHVTKDGLRAWSEYHSAEIARKDPSGPLTRLFDPLAYGLGDLWHQKKPVLVKDGRGAA